MSIILGQDGTSFGSPTTGADMASSGGAMCLLAGYQALYTGNAITAKVYTGAGGSASQFQVCVYQGAGVPGGGATLLAVSGTGTVVNNSLVSVPISVPLVAGTFYSLLLSAASGFVITQFNTGSAAFVNSQYTAAQFSFASPPGTLPARNAGTGHEFTVWLDGTNPNAYISVGGGNYTLP